MEVWIDWSSSCGDYSNNRKRSSSSCGVVSDIQSSRSPEIGTVTRGAEMEKKMVELMDQKLSERDQVIQEQEIKILELTQAIAAIKLQNCGDRANVPRKMTSATRLTEVEEDDLLVQLRNLKQVSHIRSYIKAFDELNSRAGIEEDQALSLFLSGLVDEIRVPVCLFKPKTLDEAYALSKLQELTITVMQNEDGVDCSMKDSIRNLALKTEGKLDSEMEEETYADEEIDLDVEIDVIEEEEDDWDHYIEKETDVTTVEIASDNAIQTEIDQSAAYVEAAPEVVMECPLDSAHWELKSLQNTQIQIYKDQSLPDPQIEEIEVKVAMEREDTDMKKLGKDSGLAGLMQIEGEKKEMGEAVDSCRVFKGGGMTRVAYRQVQHGEVIGGKLGKQIDLDVESATIRQLEIFQYRDENLNKTIEQFYVHFGQRLGRIFRNGVYGQFGFPQVRDMLNCFGVERLLTVTAGLITNEGAGAFSFVDDWKEQGLSLELISNNKQWLDGSCKECPVAVVVRVGMASVVEKETRIVIVAATDEKTAGNGTIQWLYWVPLSTEKELLERHNSWLDEEWTIKVNDLIQVRKEYGVYEADMSSKLADVEHKFNESANSLKFHKDKGRELEEKLTSMEMELLSTKDAAAAAEQRSSASHNAQLRKLATILSVIRNLKRFSVRFPKPMVKMKLELFSLWELLREADMLGVSRRKVVAHAWSLEQGLLVIELNFSMLAIDLKWRRWWWRISVKFLLGDSLRTRNLKGEGLLRSQIVEGKSPADDYGRVIRDTHMHATVRAVGASMDRWS